MIKLSFTNEKINAQGGLNLVGALLEKYSRVSELFKSKSARRSDRISDDDIIRTQIGLLSQARVHFEDVELFRQDEAEGFRLSMGIDKIPSESTLRQRITELAGNSSLKRIEGMNLSLIAQHQVSPLEINGRKYIANDIDVTPLDNTGSNREQVGRTYKGCDGFAPIMSNIGTEGWLLHHELRPGVQHCQKNTPEFIKRNNQLIKKLDLAHPVLHRLDSGNDSGDTILELRKSGNFFLVKRNPRKECKVKWLSHAIAQGSPTIPREGKEVYTGTLEHLVPGGEKSNQEPLTVVYQVTRRTIDKHGQALLIDDIEVESYWTNLGESPEDVIKLYHDHGTSEQYHSEIKTDLNIERLPSHDYQTNQLFFALGSVAYNLLRAIDSRSFAHTDKWPKHLKKKRIKQQRRRVRSIIKDLVCIAGKLVSHSGIQQMKIAKGWPWSATVMSIHLDLMQSTA